jgi:phospholipase C
VQSPGGGLTAAAVGWECPLEDGYGISNHAGNANTASPINTIWGPLMSVSERFTRRTALRRAGALGAAGVATSLWPASRAWAGTSRPRPSTPLRHVIIDCQENRSFDHYFGFAPFAAQSGVPKGYTQPDGNGGAVAPFEFTSLSTPDIGHSWTAIHNEWNHGAMDGFYTTDGINCMGYYTAKELPY